MHTVVEYFSEFGQTKISGTHLLFWQKVPFGHDTPPQFVLTQEPFIQISPEEQTTPAHLSEQTFL